MNVSLILNDWNKHIDRKKMFPKLEVYLGTHLEKWKKNKWIEACVSSSKVGIENLRKLFQLTTPPQTNVNDLSQNIQNSESSNEIDSCWYNSIVKNE